MGIFLFPSPCPSAASVEEQFSRLLSLRQEGASIKESAHRFLIAAEGLNISQGELKDIFNSQLNNPLKAWEMGMLGGLSFWQFVGYVYNRDGGSWRGGLPPLGPPPVFPTDCHAPSPPMTPSGRGRRKNHLPTTSVRDATLAVHAPAVHVPEELVPAIHVPEDFVPAVHVPEDPVQAVHVPEDPVQAVHVPAVPVRRRRRRGRSVTSALAV
ncbi:MAG: hypothetical protein ACRDC4_03820, partial [Plesiomonas sp.]